MQLSAALAQSSLGGKVFLCNSGTEANEAAIKLARRARPGGNLSCSRRRSTAAPTARCRRPRRSPSRRRSRRWCPGFQTVAKDPAALHDAVDENTAAVLLEPIQGETGIHVLSDELLGRRPRGVRSDRGGADLRRDPDRDGPHRHALGLRADAGRPGRADERQGARRRAADRRAGHRRAARRRRSSPETTARRSPAGRWSAPRRWRRSRSAPSPSCCARSARSASGCGRRSPSCRRSRPSAGAG